MEDLNKFYNNIAKLLFSGDPECKSLAITYMKSLIPDIPEDKQDFWIAYKLELLYTIINQCENNHFSYEYQLNNVTRLFVLISELRDYLKKKKKKKLKNCYYQKIEN